MQFFKGFASCFCPSSSQAQIGILFSLYIFSSIRDWMAAEYDTLFLSRIDSTATSQTEALSELPFSILLQRAHGAATRQFAAILQALQHSCAEGWPQVAQALWAFQFITSRNSHHEKYLHCDVKCVVFLIISASDTLHHHTQLISVLLWLSRKLPLLINGMMHSICCPFQDSFCSKQDTSILLSGPPLCSSFPNYSWENMNWKGTFKMSKDLQVYGILQYMHCSTEAVPCLCLDCWETT